MYEVIDSAQTSNTTEENKLVNCGALFITQLLGIKEIKKQERRTIVERKNLVKYKCILQRCYSHCKMGDRNIEKEKSEDKVGSSVSSQKERI